MNDRINERRKMVTSVKTRMLPIPMMTDSQTINQLIMSHEQMNCIARMTCMAALGVNNGWVPAYGLVSGIGQKAGS